MLALKVENLGKCYRIRHNIHRRLYDVMSDGLSRLKRRILHPFIERSKPAGAEDFWALRNFSFNVKNHDSENFKPHNLSDRGQNFYQGQSIEPIRGRDRLSPGINWTRKYLSQRSNLRNETQRD